MCSYVTSCVTRPRSRACRAAESRLRCLYLTVPPAILSNWVQPVHCLVSNVLLEAVKKPQYRAWGNSQNRNDVAVYVFGE